SPPRNRTAPPGYFELIGHCVGLASGGVRRAFGTGLVTNRKNRVIAKRLVNGDQPSPSYRSNWLETIGRSDGRRHRMPVLGGCVAQSSPIAPRYVLNLA